MPLISRAIRLVTGTVVNSGWWRRSASACRLTARSEQFRPAVAGWWFPAAHSDLRVLGLCGFARPQGTTVALAQWEEPLRLY